MKALSVSITTHSNLYIGGMPKGFEIGGIDMQTATQDKRPYIPASSFKGALREVCSDHENPSIAALYAAYDASRADKEDTPRHLYLFGIPGINRSPKLIFTDFVLPPETKGDFFSIDMKNSIKEADGGLLSTPRTYKVARSGLTFKGKILLRFEMLGEGKAEAESLVTQYLKAMCAEFADGVYRIGNSKSRGYGHISVDITG